MKQKGIIIAFCEQSSGGQRIKRKRMTIYLDEATLNLLGDLERASGKSASQIINEAVDYMARRDTILMTYVNGAISRQTTDIGTIVKKIICEELHK